MTLYLFVLVNQRILAAGDNNDVVRFRLHSSPQSWAGIALREQEFPNCFCTEVVVGSCGRLLCGKRKLQ